jgi:type II secretion system protein H
MPTDTDTASGRRVAAGFTLIELMVAVAIAGIIAAIAIISVDPGRKSRSVAGYAQEIASQWELARHRAVSTVRRQRLIFAAGSITHQQGTTTGLGVPASFEEVAVISLPTQITIAAAADVLQLNQGAVVTEGTGLPLTVDVLPDGRARSSAPATFHEAGWTVFLRNEAGEQVRVVLFGLTGTADVYSGW